MKQMEEALRNLAKNADTIIKLLPQGIKEAEKNLTKEEIIKVKRVMKDLNLDAELKKYDQAKKELANIFKNV